MVTRLFFLRVLTDVGTQDREDVRVFSRTQTKKNEFCSLYYTSKHFIKVFFDKNHVYLRSKVEPRTRACSPTIALQQECA